MLQTFLDTFVLIQGWLLEHIVQPPLLALGFGSYLEAAFDGVEFFRRHVPGFEGAYIPHVLFAYEPPPEACQGPTRRQYIHHVWGWTLGVAGFSAQPVWWHYKYEPAREFLERVAYPVVREIADFQANFIDVCEKTDDGKIVLAPTVSPEHWGWTKQFERNRNGAFCLGMFRTMFAAAIEGAETLGRDADMVTRWKKAVTCCWKG